MEPEKVQKQGRDERTQEDYPTSGVYFCRCRVVFLRSFISALFLYFFRLHPYFKSSFTETFFLVSISTYAKKRQRYSTHQRAASCSLTRSMHAAREGTRCCAESALAGSLIMKFITWASTLVPRLRYWFRRPCLYCLNETKSMNAQVKFPFRFRSTPFPFALKNVRVAFLLFRRVAVSLCLHSVSLRLHSVSLRLRSVVKLSVAFAFNRTSIRLIARLLLSLKAERKCTVCIQ